MIPLMTSKRLLGLTQHQSHGTSLFAVATTGFAGAISYVEEVDLTTAATIAFFGMATASFGANASSKLSGASLKKALGVYMLLIAPTIPARDYLISEKKRTKERNRRAFFCSEICRAGRYWNMFRFSGRNVWCRRRSYCSSRAQSLHRYEPLPSSWNQFMCHGSYCHSWNCHTHVKRKCCYESRSQLSFGCIYRRLFWGETGPNNTRTTIKVRLQRYDGSFGSSNLAVKT